MRLGDALMDALGGDGGGWSVGGAVTALAGAFGSYRAAARELGVAPSTFRGWRDGRTPRGGGGWLVDLAVEADRRARLPAERENAWRRANADSMRIHGTFRYTGGGSMKGAEDRDVAIGQWVGHDVIDRVIDLYLGGADADELGRAFAEAITDGGFYRDTFDPDNELGYWDIDWIEGLE